MTALTQYLNLTASSTASTANQLLENASTGGALSNKNTNLVSGTTGWVTIYAQGNGTGQSGAGSQPALADNGWIDDSSTLETNHMNAGTYSVSLGFETTTTGTFVADFHFRFYQRTSGGTRTLIGEAVASSQTIVSTSYTVLNPSVSASASSTFATGDRFGCDVTMNIITNGTTGNLRMQASNSATLGNVNAQIVTPGYSSVTTSTRTIPATAALLSTLTRTIPATVSLQKLRIIPATASIGNSRTIPVTAALSGTSTRTIPATAALQQLGITRTIPSSASLYLNSVFYASNVASTIGGLTQSDQMSQVLGGTETSFTVTAPSSGTNSYLELTSQGGSPGTTSALPAPTGKGWSISLAGSTIFAGSWYSTFTLAKSGTSKTGAGLVVRWYRRTMDGTYYLIGSSTLTGQTFSTAKTTYNTPTVSVALPWQFISGDTLYVDGFIFNASTAWASDVFTVYVSNSASQGVINDGTTTAPTLISTPAGLSALISASNFQTGTTLPVLNQSFTLADALDQRSILTYTGEDTTGTLSYQRGMPTIFSDHDQGLLYTGYVNSDKVTKIAAGSSSAQLEHQLTMMDHHYDADKRANTTNYLNWTAGDVVCDFIDKTLSQEGVTGQYAIESDYSQTAFALGTLSGTTATTTTTPFSYAPNTATPPITSNTGDLELTRAGTQFMLTETSAGDFSSGTLTNMTTSGDSLTPTTQSAARMIVTLPGGGAQNVSFGGSNAGSVPTTIDSQALAQIWSGSQLVGANDTLNYDIWISSTSPAFIAGVDLTFDDATTLTGRASPTFNFSTWQLTTIWDQNWLSCDPMTDLTNYTKDMWYTRQVPLSSVSGKHVTGVSIYVNGNPAGTYTVYVKNIYLSSASGSPFLGTSWTNFNTLSISCTGAYTAQLVRVSLEQVYNPPTSYRVSPAHSISGVGLVQNSTISWTSSNPVLGPTALSGTPGIATIASTTMIFASYDGNSWLPCAQNQALPGLPAGAKVSGLSLYLREQFQGGQDPTAIPSLLNVTITINSAANQTTSDDDSRFGTASNWNTGTYSKTMGVSSGGQLTSQVIISRDWNDNLITNQDFFTLNGPTQSASSGKYRITLPTNGSADLYGVSHFNFIGSLADFILDIDTTNPQESQSGGTYVPQCMIFWRTNFWDAAPFNDLGYFLTYYSTGLKVSHGGNAGDGTNTTIQSISASYGTGTIHWKIVVRGNRHTVFINNSTTPIVDIIDGTYSQGGIGVGAVISNSTASGTFTYDNLVVTTDSATGTWTSPSISLNSLGTVGNTQVSWSELNNTGAAQSTALVLASLDGGTTYQPCQNGAVTPTASIPGLSSGTSVVGKSLQFQVILAGATNLNVPYIYGLEARICGTYGTVTGTRISPALSLSNVGYVASSNVMWNSNVPTNTAVTVQTTQDLSSYHTVGNSGAGEALTYWTNQPSSTQDLFNSNTSANYTSTNKTGGSVAAVTYDTANSRITLSGGSGGLYLNNSISTSDVDELVDMDESDAGGLVWRKVDASNFYELGVYDASSSGGFTNQLRLYKVASNVRTLLGSASSVTFTRGTFHRIRATMQGGLINIYWDGTCVQSYLDTSPLGAGACGLRNDGGTARSYQLWIQPLGTNLSGQVLYTKVTMTTSDPAYMPQMFTLVACIRGANIATGATISQLHPITTPFAAYYSNEMDTLVRASGDYYWYIDKWKQLHFGPRLARPGAFPVQSVYDTANASGYLLYQPQVSVLSAADLFRNQQIVTDVTSLVTPPPETKVADGNTTSWQMGYPLYSAPTITINGQPGATVGVQGIDNNRSFYWQPGSPSISYDSSLPKLTAGTVLSFTYVGQSTQNVTLNNSSSQSTQATTELNSGIVAEIESALNAATRGMTTSQATTFGNGLLSRYGSTSTIELVGTTLYQGLVPGTVVPVFLQEVLSTWNAQLPVIKVTTTAYQGQNGVIYLYSADCTNGPGLNNWARVFYT